MNVNNFTKKPLILWGLAFLQLAIIVGVVFYIYAPILHRPLNNFDDLAWLKDTQIRNTFSTIFDPTLVTKNPFASTYYLPLQSALYFGMEKAFGRNPVAFHFLSIAIHALASFLIYFLVLGFTKRRFLSFLGAMFFAVYLGHHQSITWTAAAFSHPLVSVFVLSTFLFFRAFLRERKVAYYIGAIASFITALLIRESAVVVPFLLISLEILERFTRKSKPPLSLTKKELISASIKFIPFFLAVIPILAISANKFQHGALNERWGGVAMGTHPALRFLDFSTLLVYPTRMNISIKLALAGLLLSAAWWILFRFKRYPDLLFALFWIVLGLAPYTISNFNPTTVVMRYLYPAMIPFTLFLVFLIHRALEKHPIIGKLTYGLAVIAIGLHFYYLKAIT